MAQTVATVTDYMPITEFGITIDFVFDAATWSGYNLATDRVVAQFRKDIDSDTVLFTADTATSTITRPGGNTLRVIVPDVNGEALIAFPNVVWDFLHIDGSDVRTAVPGFVRWPCAKRVTRAADL